MAKWIHHWPAKQKVAGSIPSQGTCLGCRQGPQFGVCERQPNFFYMGKRFEQLLYQKIYNGKQAHKKVLNAISLSKCKVKAQCDMTTCLLETIKTNYIRYSWQDVEQLEH